MTLVIQINFYYNDLYDLKVANNVSEIGVRLIRALGLSAIVLGIIYFLFPACIICSGAAEVTIGFCIILIASWRLGYMLVLNHNIFDQKILLVGSGTLAQEIINEIGEKPDCGYNLSAAIAEDEASGFFNLKNTVVFAKENLISIAGICEQLKIKKIIVALKEKRNRLPLETLLNCRVNGYEVLDGHTFYEMLAGKLSVTALNPSWLIFSEGFQKSKIKTLFKRLFDITLSIILLIIFLPIMLLIAILIKIDSKGPVFFSQDRVGQKHRTYLVHKFRSMICDAEKDCGPVWAEDDDPRITRIGKIIRKIRFDELPQLWNVLKGEMSFVGPRPEREYFVRQLEEKIPFYSNRFIVKPGITGWAQVCYGYGASVEDAIQKLNYDLFYIKNMSVFFDLAIVLRTVKIVLFGWGR